MSTGRNSFGGNHSTLYLYFKPSVLKTQEKLLYTLRNLFAEIGGYVGIFMGYSLLYLGELLIMAITRVINKHTSVKVEWITLYSLTT